MPLDMQVNACLFMGKRSEAMDADKVFKALGDPTRRKLLDLLCEQNGQTLGAVKSFISSIPYPCTTSTNAGSASSNCNA